MPEPNIQYSVEFPDGKRANISKEVYESTKDNLYSKYPEAKVVRTSVYQPDDDDIADSDQYAISFGGNRAVISNQTFQETKDSLLAQYPDAQITKMRDESAAYWEPRRQAAMAKLDELDKQNGDFMRQYNANKTVADLLENDGVVASGQHDFVAANRAQYDTLDRQRRELLEQYYSNPNTIREYREGASRAGYLHDTYIEKAGLAETGAERRDWKRAAKLQDDIRKVYEAPNKYTDGDAANGFFQYLSDYAKGAGDVFSDKDFYTRGFTEIARNFDLRGIAKKIEEASNAKGGDLTESDIDRIISPGEKAELMSFYALSEAQRERADSISSAYRAGSSFADSVGYMAEFLLSSGLGNLAGKAMSGSSRALTSWLGKQLMSDHALRRAIAKGVTTAPQYGSKAAKILTEAAVKPLVQGIWHTGTQISSLANISEGLLETNSNGELVSVGHAILKRGVDSVIENWSESVGGALEAGLAAPFKAAGWLGEKTLGGTSFARAARWLYESGPAQVLFEAGFNGMLGEIAEEWVGNATRVAFGLMSKDEFKDFASFRQQAEMAASFAPMSLIGLGSSTMAAYRKSNQFKAVSGKVKGILQKQGVPDGEIEDLFNTKFDTAEDIGRKVAPYLYNAHQANNADDYKTILQFIELAGREAVFEEFDKVEKEQERNSMQEQIAAGAGQFWFSGEDGTDQVRVVETNGKTYYILGQGTEGTYAAISSDGERKVFTDDRLAAGVQDGTITDTNMALKDYLQQRVDATKKTAEAERMNREANEQLAAVKAQISAKPEVNLGTREAPVLAAVISSDNTGVMVAWNDEEGNYREQPLTWNEVANKLQTPIDVRTDEQLENDAAAALDDARARVAQYQKITPGTEIRVDLPELGEATYRFQKAIVDEGQVIIYAEDENGESKQFTEEMVVDLPGLLAQEDAATAVNVPEEGTNVVFTDENGDPVKGVVSVKDNGSGFTSVVTPAGDTVVIETARVEQDAAPAQEPEDDGVLRDFRGNPIPMIESGEDAGEVDLDAFFDRDTEAWARWNDEQRGDGGADSRQNIEVALKAVQKTIKTAQKEHDATASPNKRRKQEQSIAALVQRAEQLQGLIDGYVAREEAAKAEEEARRKIDEQRAAAQEREIGEPQDIIQLAVKTFETLNGLGKLRGGLNKDSFRRETGLGTAELARFFSWWAKKETGMTVNDVVDAMIELDGQYGFVPDAADGSEQKDSNAARNAVIELFSMYSSPSDLLGSIRRENTAQAEKEAASEEDAARAAFVQEYGMTPEEYEEVERQREQEVIEFGEAMEQEQEEIDNLASEYYDYYGQSAEAAAEADNLGAGVQGALGEDTRVGAVLPGERTDQTGGIPAAAEGESDQVGGEAADTGGTVQEGAPAGVIEDLPEFNDNPEVAAAEAQVDLNPTEAQKEAGNYRKGHVVIDGHDITIENPKGSVRSGVDADGNPWSVTMNNTYGYIRRTEGVDGDQIDVFLSDNPTDGNVYVVDQVKPDGSFDEHKVMYGFASAEEAQAAYLANYSPGWKGLGVITEVSKEEFAKWLDSSTRKTKPFSEYKSVEASGAQNQAQQEIAPAPAEAEAEQQEIAPAEEAVAAPAPAEETALAQPEAAPAAEAESAELTDAQKQVMEFAGVDQQDIALAEVERQAPLQERLGKWRGVIGDVFTVLTGEDDVMAIQNKATRDKFLAAKEKGETVHGFYDADTKKAYLYLPDIKDTRELDRKVLHEVISHKGLAGVMGEEGFNAFLDRVWNDMMDADSRKEFLEYVNGSSINVDDRRRAADEYVAHVAEHNTSIIKQLDETAWDKFVNAVKEILNDMIGDDFFDTGVWTVFDKELAQAFNQYRTENAEAISRADAERVRANDERRQDAIAAAQGEETRDTATRKAENNPQVPISQTQEKYEDFGEKIGWAKKDLAAKGFSRKNGEGDSRPSWMKKYSAVNVQPLSEEDKAMARRFGMRTDFQEVPMDVTAKEPDYTQPFVGFYTKKTRTRFGERTSKHYITGEDRKPIIFTSLEQYEATVPVFEARDQGYRVRQDGDKFKIVRPASNNKLVEYAEFDTREEAVAYLASPEGCTDILNRKRENYELPTLEELTRNNMPDYRNGRNITPDEFQKTFGFRGGEFGNWNNAAERQQALNYAYDALMDLANVLGLTPEALTLGGELSIAFGARGEGGASAHYEPTKAVINLTKMKGAGSLAHEWAHALDNYFGLMDAKITRNREKDVPENAAFLSEGANWKKGSRKEVRDAFAAVMKAIKEKTVTRQIAQDKAQKEYDDEVGYARKQLERHYREEFARGLTKYQYNRKTKEREMVKIVPTEEQLAEYDRLCALLIDDPTFKFEWDYKKNAFRASGDIATQLYELVKDVMPNRGGERFGPLHNAFYYLDKAIPLRERLEKAKAGEMETVNIPTTLMDDSKWFDRMRASDYFAKDIELFARSFENYVSGEMLGNGQSSDYLTYEKGPLYEKIWGHNPYPAGTERADIKMAFDNLFRTIQEKTDENTGKRVLFSQAYHGTGADFELFDLSHAGEGEGAAAHGYGVYVTFNLKTAKGYAEKLSGMSRKERQSRNEELERLRNEMRRVREQEKDREEMLREEAEDVENPDEKARLLKEADSLANEGGSHYKSIQRVYRHKQLLLAAKDSYITYRDVTVDTPINKLANIADATRMIFFAGSYEGAIEEYKRHEDGEPGVGLYDAYHFLKSTSPEDWVAHRNLYKVEIPDDNGDNYLDEDAMPTFNQLSRVFMGLIERRDDSYRKFVMIPQSISTESGRGLYKTISDVLGGKKAASDFLQSVGFDGIKYDGEVDGPCAVIFDDDVVSITEHIRFSKRTKPAPTKTGIGYKVFFRGKDGKLYPPMVANPDGADTPVGVWLDADAAPVAGQSKTGRLRVKSGGKGTQGGSGRLAYRPGWHLGEIPYAIQFNRLNPETGQKDLFPAEFVWAEVEYAADKDYQSEADAEGMNKSGKYQHSLAGLKKVPEDGFYRYRTNPNPETDPWIITGAMKVNRVLTNEEVDELVRKAGREPQKREPEVRFSKEKPEAGFPDFRSGGKDKISDLQMMVSDAIKEELSKRGYANVFTNRSDTKAGLSTYLDVFDNRWDRVAKIRISDHSVTSDRRILSEYHVFPGQTAKEVVDDVLGKEREPEVRFSKESAGDILDRYENQDGSEEYPWMSESEMIDRIESELPYGNRTEEIFSLIDKYRRLDAEDFDEGRRDFSGSERDEVFNDIVDALREYSKGDVRFSKANESQRIFISNAAAAAEAVPMDKATPEQWQKMLSDRGGMKAGEDKWIGLSDWLKNQDRKTITKQEVLDFINQNQIQIEEEHYDENPKGFDDLAREYDNWLREEGYDYAWEQLTERFGDDAQIAFTDNGGELEISNGEAAATLLDSDKPIHNVRLDYTTAGLENKREIALTVPTIEPWNENDEIHFGDAGNGRAIAWIRFGDAKGYSGLDQQRVYDYEHIKKEYGMDWARAKTQLDRGVTGRTKNQAELDLIAAEKKLEKLDRDFADVAGKVSKVLVIDEIQSKRHQEAREQGGYKNPELQAKAERRGELSRKFYSEEGVSLEEKKEYDALQQELYEIGEKEVVDNAGRPSAAPFEKNWHELAMKRMLRLAAEEGYDYVAWTTGDQQAVRYNIGQYLQSVDKTDEGKFTLFLSGGNTTDIEVDENGIITDTDAFSEEWEGKKLSDVVGKEIAVRMMSMEVDSDDLDKIDATIGAEGMKGFYDGILVNFMNKYGKKWGIQVEDINLPGLEESARTAHAVSVTPEMKESVLQGQLMFSKEGGEKRARTPLETAYDVDRGGIKAVVGEENVSDFYNGLYRAMPEQLRAGIVSRAEDAGWNFHEALKGRLAELALAGNDDSGLLRLAERMLSDYYGHPLDEATARYILWRTAQPNDSLTDIQKTALKRRWKVGEKDADIRFSKGDLGRRLEETSQVVGVIADGAKESLDQQKKALKGELRTVARAMSAQKVYDRSTVDTITGLAKQVLKDQEIETMSRREIARLMGLIRTSVGKAPRTVKHNADILLDIIIDNLLRTEENRLAAIVRTGASRTNASGVEVQGKLDVRGQNVLKAYRAGLDMPVGKPDDDETEGTVYARLALLQERLDSEDDAVRAEAEAEYDGLTMALEYHENIKASRNEERSLRDDMAEAAEEARRGGMSRAAYNEYVEDTQSALRENRVDRIESFRELRIKLAELIEGSKTNAAAFRQRERDRINAIHHLANSDMQGRTADQDKRSGRLGNFLNSSLVRFFTSPLATFDQMLRAFGSKSVNGQGYLWNKYMREWIEARENEIKGTMEAKQALDRKASEVFGKEMRWSDIYDIVRDMPKAKVKWWSGGAMQDHELTQGQLLYIYMVNKMADGRMKLRRMGISEEDVQAIRNQMDERFITLADWLQDEFLVGLRNKYNAVHERLFGASMAAIEDYFPLVINKRSINKQEDIAAEDNGDTLPATTTGSIIKRRRNSRNLDLLNADAFDVVIRHIEQMERWAAFAEYNRDLNTLLSYNHFRNQVKNMETIYGTGDVLWKNFRNVSRIAGNTYHPTVKSESLDSAAVNLAKGVTAAKINFRIYTAMKQFLSMPAFLADANIGKLAGSIAHQQQSWKWAMENLPLFESRWKSRIAGDTRLMKTDSDWKLFRSRAYDKLSRMGMSPNAFVDALTVSIGAKALYDTKYERYIEDGYTEEQAAKKAKQDATILYNETQQSSEGAFVSTVQLDRTLLSTMISVFRNSSMGFQRQLHDALRNLARRTRSGYREESLEFMTKQGVRDGLTEEQAAAAAEREYNRGMWHDMARVATFGMVVQFAWNLGASLAYLLFGDDDDKKEEMVREAFIHSLFGSIEGLSGGNIMSEALNMVAKGESLRNYDPSLLPIISDMKRIYSTWSYDKVAAFNSLANLAAQAGFGANPETITDAVVAVVDASKGDLGVANEAMLLILRVLQVPQSQLDEIYIDELGMNARSARRLNYRQMADRYAKYKIAREAGAFVGIYSDEKRKAREESRKKTFQKKVNERKKIKK